MRRSLPWLALSLLSLLLLTCTGQQPNPFQQSDANITPALENSFGQTSDSTISDTVGNRISIGIRPYLASFIDSVRVVVHSGSTTDTSFTFGKNSDWANNPRIVVPFRSVGTRIASFTVFIGSSEKFDSATVKILARPINITTKSSNDSVTQSDSITFAAGVSDTGLHSFQWYKDTTILSGATQATLTINPVLASSAGSYTCLIRDQYGDTARTPAAILTVKQPVIPNRRPVLEVTGLRNITVAQTCSLSLSAQDSDAGQTQVFSLVKGPQGGTLTGPTFKWVPPSGFTGIDTVVFAVTDNGTPPLSDTVPVYITVSESLSLQITTLLPPATSVVPGSSTALTVVAGGTVPIAYQWYYNGTAISGATTSSYSKTWGASDGGFYKVVVSNAGGKDSSATQVTVCPRITAGLGPNTSIVINSSSALSVTATGTAPLAYQWYVNGTAITGATTNSYSKTWASGDGGVYKVVVTNSAGSDSSQTAVTINSSITTPLLGTTNITQGSTTALSVAASGTPPITYQWYFNGTAITGATGASYSKTWGGSDGGIYKVVVTNPTGTDSSSTQVTVNPVIATGLAASISVGQGSSTALSVVVTGSAPITYQWYYNGTAITGAATNSYSKTWGATDGGIYKVVVSNAAGKDSSSTQLGVSPLITAGLGATTSIATGSQTTLSVTAGGTAPLSYQWFYNGTAITAATNASYSKNWTASDGGVYKVVVTNAAGSDSSKTTVTINSSITTPLPGTTNVAQGSATPLTIVASGTPPITYQWYYNSTAITGATSASYSKTWGAADGGVYKVVVTNPTGTDSSSTQLTVAPVITAGLSAGTSVAQAGSTALSVTASGTATITYQWYLNGTAITGATTNSYSKTWGAADGGTYKVVATNAAGKDSSTTQVTVSPMITAGLGANTSISINSTTALSVTAAGTATLAYQWYLNGTAITGATSNSYSKTWGAADGGVYKVVVTNAAGSDSSKTTVTINSSITTPLPGTTNVVQGSTTPLTIVASGTPPITYQWYYNGTAITGATSASYSKTWGAADGGVYKVVVTNPTGKDSSSTQLTVAPVITAGLSAGTSVAQAGSTALSVTASGTATITYQWYFNGTAITAATTNSYSKTWGAADGGTYKVVATNAAGKDSSTTQVTVSPMITAGLGANTSISINSTTALSVTAAGTATLAYQWYLNGTAITGATSNSYSKTWGAGDGGVYKVVVTNAAGSDSSKTTVTINSSITTPLPGTTNVVQGSTTPLTIVASGTPPITYQWYYNGTAITGATSASYSKTWGAADGGVYKVVVTNGTGKDSSSTQLVVAPVITSGLSATTYVAQGGSTALSVTATGTLPLSYQWYLNGAVIPGQTLSSYSKTWTATDGGVYKVVVSNAAGSDSSKTTLTVAPVITSRLSATTSFNQGSTTALSITATGTATITYQWYFNNVAITTNGTSSSYSTTWQYANAGTYRVAATNAAGTDTSSTVVTVKDVTKPTIFLKGFADTTIALNSIWSEPGDSAWDDKDGVITSNVVVTGTVNPLTIGKYTLTYNVSDAAGNAATTVTRTVRVEGWQLVNSSLTATYVQLVVNSSNVLYVAYISSSDNLVRVAQLNGTTLVPQGGTVNTAQTYDMSLALAPDGVTPWVGYIQDDAGDNAAAAATLSAGVWSTKYVNFGYPAFFDIGVAADNTIWGVLGNAVLKYNGSTWDTAIATAGSMYGLGSMGADYRDSHVMSFTATAKYYSYPTTFSTPATGLVVKMSSGSNWVPAATGDSVVVNGENGPPYQMACNAGRVFAVLPSGEDQRDPNVFELKNSAWTQLQAAIPAGYGAYGFSLSAATSDGTPFMAYKNGNGVSPSNTNAPVYVKKYNGASWVGIPANTTNPVVGQGASHVFLAAGNNLCYLSIITDAGVVDLYKWAKQ